MNIAALIFATAVLVAQCESSPVVYDDGTLGRAVVLGDSITHNSREQIDTALEPWQLGISASIGQTTADHLQASYVNGETDPDVLVVALGTNDANLGADAVEFGGIYSAIVNAHHAPCTVAVTISEDWYSDSYPPRPDYPERAADLNGWIRSEAASRGWVVVEWALLADEHPEWFYDGVHLRPQHLGEYATAIAAGVDACPS